MTEKLAIVTGAETGIASSLRTAAKDFYDLLIAADEAAIEDAASLLQKEQDAADIQALKASRRRKALKSSLRRPQGGLSTCSSRTLGAGLGYALRENIS